MLKGTTLLSMLGLCALIGAAGLREGGGRGLLFGLARIAAWALFALFLPAKALESYARARGGRPDLRGPVIAWILWAAVISFAVFFGHRARAG